MTKSLTYPIRFHITFEPSVNQEEIVELLHYIATLPKVVIYAPPEDLAKNRATITLGK